MFLGVTKGSDGGAMAVGMTTCNADVCDNNMLAVKASQSGKVGSGSHPCAYQSSTNETAKSVWSGGEVLNLSDQAAVLTTAGPTIFSTTDAGLTAAVICPVP